MFTKFDTKAIEDKVKALCATQYTAMELMDKNNKEIQSELIANQETLIRNYMPLANDSDFIVKIDDNGFRINSIILDDWHNCNVFTIGMTPMYFMKDSKVFDIKDYSMEYNVNPKSYKEVDKFNKAAHVYTKVLSAVIEFTPMYETFCKELYDMTIEAYERKSSNYSIMNICRNDIRETIKNVVETETYAFGTDFRGILNNKTAKSEYWMHENDTILFPIFVKARPKYIELTFVSDNPELQGLTKGGEIKKEEFFKQITAELNRKMLNN